MNLERTPSTVVSYPPWLRGWCGVTAAATFALIAIGTLVTTFHVGMADKLWPTAPWHLMLIERVPSFGFYVEHTHRIAGYVVGVCILVQTLIVWNYCPDWYRRLGGHLAIVALAVGTGLGMWLVRRSGERSAEALLNPGSFVAAAAALGILALAGAELFSHTAGRWQRALVAFAYVGVIVQGILGGLRVYLNELQGPELALVHGIFAQAVFAAACLLVLMSGRSWNSLLDIVIEGPLRKLTAATLLLLLAQFVFGGLLRHLDHPLGRRFHPLLAFAVVALIVWTAVRTFQDVDGGAALRRNALVLLTLAGIQVALGVEAWLWTSNVANRIQAVGIADATLRSLHVLTGFGVFATAALLTARAWKARLL